MIIQANDLVTIQEYSRIHPVRYGKVLYVLSGSHNCCISGLSYWKVEFGGKWQTIREDQIILIHRGEQ